MFLLRFATVKNHQTVLRSEISFSRTCNIQKLILCNYRLKRYTGCVSMVAQLRAHYNKNLFSVKFF